MKRSATHNSIAAPHACGMGRKGRYLLGAASVLLLFFIWWFVAWRIDEPVLLPTPSAVAKRLYAILGEGAIYESILFTLSRISHGFFGGLLAGVLLALPAAVFPTAEIFLRPWFFTVKSIPVASFVVLAIVWVGEWQLSALISFLMVTPIVYHNLLEGLRHTSKDLSEMADVLHLPFSRRLIYIYVPQVKPHLLSACRISLGLAWKAGVAAEMIAYPKGSIGELLQQTKWSLDTESLIAYTLLIVLMSFLFEKLLTACLSLGFRLWEKL